VTHAVATPPPPQPDLPDRVPSPTPARGVVHRFSFDVAIVGLGYVGLPTALACHAAGQRVLALDINESRIEDIRAGAVDLSRSDIDRLEIALADGRVTFDAASSYLHSAATVLICVPTPVDAHQQPDLGALRAACRTAVSSAVPGQVLVLTSTTYVGSTRELLGAPLERRGLAVGRDVAVAFSPERIDPGNDRRTHGDVPRVVGGLTAECTQRAMDALAGCATRLHAVSSAECAEFTKLYENTFRAINIAYVNEMSVAARTLGLDMAEVVDAAATKPFGFMPFMPGPGVGGHCIPCDPQYLLWQLRPMRERLPLVEQAMIAIEQRPLHVVARLATTLAGVGRSLAGSEVLVVGVTYKPNVHDVRESPALVIIERLIEAGASVRYFDPHVPSITLSHGRTLQSQPTLAGCAPDVALLHTAHAGVSLECLPAECLLLNTTYRPVPSPAIQTTL
jgi:nucleotide sugar dehydrogenase